MKKSELFLKIYSTVSSVEHKIGMYFDEDTISPEMEDEKLDLGITDNNAAFVSTFFEWYSCRLTRVLSVVLTEVFSEALCVDNDIDLKDFEAMESLIPDD